MEIAAAIDMLVWQVLLIKVLRWKGELGVSIKLNFERMRRSLLLYNETEYDCIWLLVGGRGLSGKTYDGFERIGGRCTVLL